MRDMMAKGMPHKDPSDYHCGFNVSTAWGDYTTARMVFWELGITVEVQKGEVIFFLPRIITHNAVDVQGGVRNVVDAFVHENVLIWKDRQQEEVTGEYRGPSVTNTKSGAWKACRKDSIMTRILSYRKKKVREAGSLYRGRWCQGIAQRCAAHITACCAR
jgi:hypothetical protein